MKVAIFYCTAWGYAPKAFRVKDEIEKAYKQAEVFLIPKRGGFFDIIVDDKPIFSKTEKVGTKAERFPEPGEIISLMKKAGF